MGFLDNNNLSRVWNKMKTWVQTQLPEDFSGATTASAGIHGLVPAPETTDSDKFLRGDGSWADGGTDVNVTQTESTANENYEILVSGTASTATVTEGAKKSSKFIANPYNGAVTFGTRKPNSSMGGYSFTQGINITASGSLSHAEGYDTIASGMYTHAEGGQTTASGDYGHTEGGGTIASGRYSHAEGAGTTASGYYTHAEGSGAKAVNDNAHAEGSGTNASGNCAHAEGGGTIASGMYAHAEGTTTEANHKAQHVFGEYNMVDASTAAASERGTYVEIVGNGTTPNARSNARTLDWSGNEVLAGKLTVGAAPTNNMDVATKKYVDDAVTAAIAQVLAAQY